LDDKRITRDSCHCISIMATLIGPQTKHLGCHQNHISNARDYQSKTHQDNRKAIKNTSIISPSIKLSNASGAVMSRVWCIQRCCNYWGHETRDCVRRWMKTYTHPTFVLGVLYCFRLLLRGIRFPDLPLLRTRRIRLPSLRWLGRLQTRQSRGLPAHHSHRCQHLAHRHWEGMPFGSSTGCPQRRGYKSDR